MSKTKKRSAGILMPVSALPSSQGIGTLGKGAYEFIDWLHSAGMKVWQVLPLVPTGFGDSPYQSCSSDALNPYFIDFELLEKEGLLERADYAEIVWSDTDERVDYGRQFAFKAQVLRKAFARFDQEDKGWKAFLAEGKYVDFATFMTLKRKFSYAAWLDWEEPYKSCKGDLPEEFYKENAEELLFWQFTQYIFRKQWDNLRGYAASYGIKIMGDMPIYLAEDSVEAWKYRDELFMLDEDGNFALRAGVPPDAFSEDGQFWGNPVYDWDKIRANGYAWWKKRLNDAFGNFDIIRIDHFRAFDRFYAVPDGAENAKEGEWLDGPKTELFQAFEGDLQIVAEDLGTIDGGVRLLLEKTGFPGMKVFEFAFDGNPDNEYLPSNITDSNCVAYTGTHDNDTLRSFIENMENGERKYFERTLEDECLKADVPYLTETIEDECKTVVELLMSSKAELVIVPMQDVLFLGEEARLNAPSTVSSGNWTFRFSERAFKRKTAAWLKGLAETYKR